MPNGLGELALVTLLPLCVSTSPALTTPPPPPHNAGEGMRGRGRRGRNSADAKASGLDVNSRAGRSSLTPSTSCPSACRGRDDSVLAAILLWRPDGKTEYRRRLLCQPRSVFIAGPRRHFGARPKDEREPRCHFSHRGTVPFVLSRPGTRGAVASSPERLLTEGNRLRRLQTC
ncbi:unnamed protein product [Pleuronectes platessa]|uniref:Secreted protein n=1 Tax=Pleuronectes platessa TaxID=8262 RepID=A0A9N7Z6L8_PLEPL|nr:unnamed protein product [Pleuronectes platessa]